MARRPIYERVYRALIRLLPSAFRHEFGASMAEDFLDQRRSATIGGRHRLRTLWLRTIGGLLWLASREHLAAVGRDVTHASRLFRRRPAFTMTTVLTLTVGIGVTTATFTVVQAIVLQGIPGPESDRIVAIFEVSPAPESRPGSVSNANFVDWQGQVTTLDALALYNSHSGLVQIDGAPAEQLQGMAVSDDFLRLTGLTPRLGRVFVAEDFTAWHAAYASSARSTPAPRVIVLSEGAWRRIFGANPGIVGTTVALNESPVEVIGVMADHPLLSTFGSRVDYWTTGGAWSMVRRGARMQQAVGRLGPGVTLDQAQAEFDVVASRLTASYPADNTGWTVRVKPLREAVTEGVTTQLWFLLGASLCVALVAMLNVARLVGTLNEGRRSEFLTRLSLGASRLDLMRQGVTEGLILSVAGGALGVLLAWLLLPVIISLAPENIPRLGEVAIHPQTIGFALALTLAVGVVCGLASRAMSPIRLVTGGQYTGRTLGWARSAVLGGQVALALVLAIGTSVLVRSMQAVGAEPLGFAPQNVVASTIALPRSLSLSRDLSVAQAKVQRIVDRLEAHPGVVAAAAGPRPLGSGPTNVVRIPGQAGDGTRMMVGDVTAHYFQALGGTVTSGRTFVETDAVGSPAPVVLNAQAVRDLGLDSDPVGRELLIDTLPVVVIGVVANIRQALETAPGPVIYLPAGQSRSTRSGQLIIRTSQPPELILPDLRAIVGELDSDTALYRMQTMEDRLRELTAPRRFVFQLVATFSVLAIGLAVIGLAGVVAESVSQRVRELGIRMALGAPAGTIISLVVSEGLRVVLAGAAAGLVLSYQLRHTLERFVYGVTTTDSWSYVASAGGMLLVGLVACYFPARRAAAIDPLAALRSE